MWAVEIALEFYGYAKVNVNGNDQAWEKGPHSLDLTHEHGMVSADTVREIGETIARQQRIELKALKARGPEAPGILR